MLISKFAPELEQMLPETSTILHSANFHIHDAVERVTLHGSRGIDGLPRADSDIDLCLIVRPGAIDENLLRAVLLLTLDSWKSQVKPDLAAVYDSCECGLDCFEYRDFQPDLCKGKSSCFGLFKIQAGFNGFVSPDIINRKAMYPVLKIWDRKTDL